MSAEPDVLSRQILGAAFEVVNTLGHGFLEKVYQRALRLELEAQGLRVKTEVPFEVAYKGEPVGTYIADLLVNDTVILELKCVEAISTAHLGQVLNYLRAARKPLGLVLNFGKPKLEYRRVVNGVNIGGAA